MMHAELQDQIPLYALGDLSADETARLETHLAVCPACRALLAEYQFVATELLEQVPAQTMPARIGVRLQNIAQADVKNSRAGLTPPKSESASELPFWKRRLSFPRWAAALALVVVLLLVGGAGALAWQMQQRDNMPEQVVRLLSTRGLEFVEMTRPGVSSSNHGFLCKNTENPTGLLWLYGLEPLDYDHVYQVWLRNNDTRVSGGTFRPNHDGRAVAVINAPQPLGYYSEIGITVEPVPGSPDPTTQRVVGAHLY